VKIDDVMPVVKVGGPIMVFRDCLAIWTRVILDDVNNFFLGFHLDGKIVVASLTT
jgi:hypothetical protein